MATRRRKRKRLPPRSARLARSPQPPRAVELWYELQLRQASRVWARKVQARLLRAAREVTGERADASPEDAAGLADAGLDTLGSLTRTLATVAERTTRHSQTEFRRLGIRVRDGEPKLGKLIARWRKRNVSLVTKLFKSEAKKLEKLLTEGEGRTYKALAGEIQERLGIATRRAELIARDQVLTLNAQINQERQAAAGITEFAWTTAGDERVRQSHRELDGRRFKYADPPLVDGVKALPGEPVQCRCVAYPILPELED